MRHVVIGPLLILLLIAACQSSSPSPAPAPAPRPDPAPREKEKSRQEEVARAPLEAPALASVVKLYDAATGERLDLAAMVSKRASHEVVFFGETHLDETTHRLELAVYEKLIEATGGKVVLAMEMFERDVQQVLDDYLAGKIDEAAFLHKARVWGNYRTGYRALVETAKKHKLPVVASNAPAALRRLIGFHGRPALDRLPSAERKQLARKLLPNTDAYWERFARVVRGHMTMIAGDTPEKRLTSGQSLWDNTMGESCVNALKRWPGYVVFHVNGSFHSKYREGVVTQVLERRPATRVAVLEAVAVSDLPGVAAWKDRRADFLAAVDARARARSQGFFAVTVAAELRFKLHLPPRSKAERPVPLLVWLGDESFRASDGLKLWKTALGDEAALLVIEPPYPRVTDDLYRAGTWYWAETFSEDLGTVASGIQRIVEYALRNFPLDRSRVVVAGQGTGATTVTAAALYSGGLSFPALAVAPRRFSGLHSMSLPAPRETARTITVVTGDHKWWKRESADHETVGVKTRVLDAPESGWGLFMRAEDLIRSTLGLAARPAPDGTSETLSLLVDTPRSRYWAHLMARRMVQKGRSVDVTTGGSSGHALACLGEAEKHGYAPGEMLHGTAIPMAVGPFGGTTVLYVPRGRTEEQRAEWQSLEDAGVLKKRSRFARLKVVFEEDEEDNLAAALQETVDKGRRVVLIVPAVFCATPEQMRRWAAEAKKFEEWLDITWSPGLGGSLPAPAGG